MDVLAQALAAALFLALLIERLVEYLLAPPLTRIFSAIIKALGWTEIEGSAIIPYLAAALGIFAAVAWNVDLISPTLTSVGWETPATWYGELLTGLLLGGGSNLLHDIWPAA